MNYIRKERVIHGRTDIVIGLIEIDLEENPPGNFPLKNTTRTPPLWKEDENVNLPVGSMPEEKGARDHDPTSLELLAIGEGDP